ncbi:MAG: contractile injection system tape measure protein [Bacteroidia bacterium]
MNHLIQSQQIELSLQGDERAAFGLQERMSNFFQQEMLPQMSSVLDQWVSEDESWQIDRIELDLGVLNEDELFSALSLDRLAERLASALQAQESVKISIDPESPKGDLGIWQLWSHFLIKGTLPWYAKQLPDDLESALLSAIESNPTIRKNLIHLLQKRPIALRRFCLQMKQEFVEGVLKIHESDLTGRAIKLWEMLQVAITKGTLDTEKTFSRGHHFDRLESEFWQFQVEQILLLATKPTLTDWEQKNLVWLSQALPRIETSFWQDISTLIPEAESFRASLTKAINPKAEVSDEPNAALAKDKTAAIEAEELNQAFGEAAVQDSSKPENEKTETDTHSERESISTQESDAISKKSSLTESSHEAGDTEDEFTGSKKEDNIKPDQIGDSLETKFLSKRESGEIDAERLDEDELALELSSPAQKAEPAFLLSDQNHFLNHAGVILCHAYLSSFWQNLGWVKNGAFVDLRSQEQAVLSLHYLAFGERQAPEYKLTLAKILCGLALNHPLNVRQELSLEDAEEADNLLAAVIKNWGALGEVSNDSLREGFLQRPGKLSLKSGKWRLLIERQTIDILLDRLPWSIGIVKLPWMPDPIMVDWN